MRPPAIWYTDSMNSMDLLGLVQPLLEWYDENKRDLPWRHEPTPYAVWVSEIMLQQTRVETVKEYYVRWMERLPTVEALAEADPDVPAKLWEGLGYYSRVRHMQQAAKLVVEKWNGKLPANVQDLAALPGIGEYTAGAIAAIAYGIPTPAVDGNVLRVLARYTGDSTDILSATAKKQAGEALRPVIPAGRSGDYVQAMFEWGALVCVPKNPDCEHCPVRTGCRARALGIQDELPVRIVKTKRKIVPVTVLVVRVSDTYWLTKPCGKGLLGGLYGLPYAEGHWTEQQARHWAEQKGLTVHSVCTLRDSEHVFSHITWQMHGFLLDCEGMTDEADKVWCTRRQIDRDYALPSAFAPYRESIV